jgi:GPH family glycoside/pentoside/hexuronide:cation symporter
MTRAESSAEDVRAEVGPRAAEVALAPSGLRRSVLVSYALPSIATHFAMTLMGIYFFKYATDVLLLAPMLMGFLFAAARFWDGLSDPIAGYLSDRTHARLGRRRSWLAASVLPFGLSVLMLWSPLDGLSESSTALWVGVGLFLFYTTYTALSVPYGALGAELSEDYHDRTRIFAYRQGVGAIGLLCAVVAYYFFLESERAAVGSFSARDLGLGVGLFAVVFSVGSVAILLAWVPERPSYQDRGPVRIFGAFGDVLRNPHARRLLVVQCLHYFSVASLSIGSAFLFQHVMGVPSWAAALLVGCFAGGMLLAIPIWVSCSRRFGKDRCWRFALIAVGTLYLGVFFGMGADFASPVVLVIAALGTTVLGGFQSSDFVLSHSMQADVIDFDEVQTDQRKEGAYLATWSFAEKCSAAVAAGLIGLTLQVVGYEPGEAQSADTRLAIIVLMSLVPSACHYLGALVLRGYALDEREHARIRAVLESRRPRAHD